MYGKSCFKLTLSAILIVFVLVVCCPSMDSSEADNDGTAYSVDGSTLVIRSNIDSSEQMVLSPSEWDAISEVRIENDVTRIADGSLSKCVNVDTVTAPYIAFKDKIPNIFGLQDYPKCEIVLMEGEFKHLILCSDIIKSYTDDV